jgi:hypothetical protein
MSRRNIHIYIGKGKPDDFLKLCEAIVEQNTALGAASPFADATLVDMTKYATLTARARQKREEALEYYALAQAAMFESRQIMGKTPGQTVDTEGTLYNLTVNVKKLLLVLNRTNPEELSLWGFDVVVSTGKKTGPKKKK